MLPRQVGILLLLAGTAGAVRVLQFQGDGRYTTESFVYSPPIGTDLTNFTLCTWFKANYWRPKPYMFQLATSKPVDTEIIYALLQASKDGVPMVSVRNKRGNVISAEFSRNQWNHLCVVSRVEVGLSSLYINGIKHQSETYEGRTIPGGAVVVLGQDQDEFKGGYDETQAFSGWITNFGISENVLTPEKIGRIAASKEMFEGDILTTEDVHDDAVGWEVSRKVDVFDQNDTTLFCGVDRSLTEVAAMQGGKSFGEVNETCTVMGGKLLSAEDISSPRVSGVVARTLWKFFKNQPAPLCLYGNNGGTSSVWLTDNWSPEKEVWVNPFSGREHRNLSYVDVDLASQDDSRCLMYVVDTLHAASCKHVQPCTYCTLKHDAKFRLRGLCPEERATFDTEYAVHGVRNGRFYLRGAQFSHIYFEKDSVSGRSSWILESLRKEGLKVLATRGHPFGEREWAEHSTVQNCCPQCNGKLTLSTCLPDEFTCGDGHCIPISEKCDSIYDCPDQSDELDCMFVHVGKTYLKDIVPRGRDPGAKPMEVELFASVLSIVNVDTVDLKFTLDFTLTVEWYDDRLQYWDLNDNEAQNSIGESTLVYMWTPMIMMQNALGNEFVVYDEKVLSFIRKEQENGTLVGIASSANTMLFDGKKNPISVTRRYFQDFSCDMDLMAYPFDTQVCKVTLASLSQDQYTQNSVALSAWPEVDYGGPELLLEYRIMNMTMETVPKRGRGYHRAILKVVLQRRVEYHLMNTFLQTLLLVIVGCATCLFELENFTDKIMVTLTTMLVTATIMGSIQSGLPKTSYYKLIDIWLLFTLLVQVGVFGLHTVVGVIVNKSSSSSNEEDQAGGHAKRAWAAQTPKAKKTPARAVNTVGGILIAVAIVAFNGSFWYIAIEMYSA